MAWGLGIRFGSLGFEVQGLEFGVLGLERTGSFRVGGKGSELRKWGSGSGLKAWLAWGLGQV